MAKETVHTFILSDSSKTNSRGFRIALDGINRERFTSNPVMLYSHRGEAVEDVIGKWENLRIDGGKLLADAVFDSDDDTAKKVKGKVDRGFLRACSIGVIIDEMEWGKEYDVVTKCELLEASITPIPADAGAVKLYDKNREKIDFEQLKLKFNNQKEVKMNKESDNSEKAIQEKDAEIARLKADISNREKEIRLSFLNLAVKEGKIKESEKVHFEALAEKDFDSVKAIIDSRETKPSKSMAELFQEAKTVQPSGRENWSYLQWMKEDEAGLKRMKSENPSEFERLQNSL